MSQPALFRIPRTLAVATFVGSIGWGQTEGSHVSFVEVSADLGLTFQHVSGASDKKYMVETMGAGLAVLDYDLDGDPDVYFVQGGSVPGASVETAPPSTGELFRNREGRFERVTELAGIAHTGYGMGAVSGDIDNDGDPDLYVTQVGPNLLFLNRGDGTFEEVASARGADDLSWGASGAFADLDNDGDSDLFVANYIQWSAPTQPDCSQLKDTRPVAAYCLPDAFAGAPDALLENLGDGTFRSIGHAAGIADESGKGLGVITSDFDQDGLIDLYVANDTVPNFLHRNRGGMSFTDVGLLAGGAYDFEGNALAGMGVDSADIDHDGDVDLFVTNFQGESNTLYRNDEGKFFTDVSFEAGVGPPSLDRLGFGTAFADLNNDGWEDLVVANGHVLDNAAELNDGDRYPQPDQVFLGRLGGRFLEVPEALDGVLVSRGLVILDWDSDYDLDILTTSSNGPAVAYRNDTATDNRATRLVLVGRQSNRDGLGARLLCERGDGNELRELVSGGSYLSDGERVIHLGLGREDSIVLQIRWPSSITETLELRADELAVAVEGRGIVKRFLRAVEGSPHNESCS